jgi:hypothetical protein
MKQLTTLLLAIVLFASCEKDEAQPKEKTNCYGFSIVRTDFKNIKDSSTLKVDTIITIQCYFTVSTAESFANARNVYTPYTTNDTIKGYFQTVCTFVKY